MTDPWRARHFGSGYSAEYLPTGQHSWRLARGADGKPLVLPNRMEAEEAAKAAFLRSCEPEIRATCQRDPDDAAQRMADKLAANAEDWLRSSRSDKQAASIMHRKGGKRVLVMAGRAR